MMPYFYRDQSVKSAVIETGYKALDFFLEIHRGRESSKEWQRQNQVNQRVCYLGNFDWFTFPERTFNR
jgi:hypothetical protein